MKSFQPIAAVVVALVSSPVVVESFAPSPSSRRVAVVVITPEVKTAYHDGRSLAINNNIRSRIAVPSSLFASKDKDTTHDNTNDISRRSRLLSSIRQRSKPITLALLTATAFLPGQSLVLPAKASAPIVLRAAKKKDDPPIVQAQNKAAELKKARSLEEFDVFMAKCNDIEVAEGKKARDAYERQYQIDKAAAEAQKKVDVENLKRKLLDQGRDPFTDLGAERDVFLLEHDVDLEKVPGTPQNENMIKNFQSRGRRNKKGGKAGAEAPEEHAHQRYIVACQVADLKARGVDPMEHFAQTDVKEKTRAIYKMDDRVAEKVAIQYKGLMEEHGGRLTPAKEGEVPFVYAEDEAGVGTVASGAAVAVNPGRGAQSRNERAEARAARKAQRAAEKAEAREARVEAKAQKRAETEKLSAEKAASAAAAVAAKEAAAVAAASTASAVADADIAATSNEDMTAAAGSNALSESPVESSTSVITQQTTASTASSKANEIVSQIKTYATPKNIATVVVGGGAAVFGINYYKENNGAAQSERERQLKLILGEDEDEDEEDDDDFDDEDDDEYEQFTKKSPEPPKSKPTTDDPPKAAAPKTPPTPPVESPKPAAPKPKRLGIFSKRNANLRETDLNNLVKPAAQGAEFASLLAKILTFGAPGRFPAVAAWGDMPFDEFDLTEAKALLTESRGDAELTDEQSAEIFASVVNCMIIDIVDLASSTLKVKNQEEKVTVDAINVVMDFMDHAASLFDAVAQDVTIKPVTYGGKIRKKDLEQMFSVYAGSSMMSLDALAGGGGASQDRVDTLQLVFAITDKKAEGLMQKHMMKMMMNLMKDGGKGMEGMPGMEGMDEMMKAMGGAEGGMPGMGMPGMDGGDMSPEDLKQTLGMMKDLMDSGQVSEEELKEVRGQFKEMYGEDISDLIKKASDEGAEGQMTDDERELMDMFKRILGDE
mmetsp:Transcript_23271/g.41976  ORF Transcript_23271/g.41976 Transcript_23271/m.41976 type:complete len:941 (+) Transcript_23271:172-2994(+)|eukprot:CAMPEP_0196137458 /NCGR_PEP_ID=MMETSP0910-20130528/5426_1 /TAXON_ID=49265 /ORGANISM="Thalassiosira rotula, Strain GSO102" /LENGTH=940 /DNA_ID=CAMNT_0041397917 /DNA_START=111 /DNA_END=2933 /DNA_ORIENTATION=+